MWSISKPSGENSAWKMSTTEQDRGRLLYTRTAFEIAHFRGRACTESQWTLRHYRWPRSVAFTGWKRIRGSLTYPQPKNSIACSLMSAASDFVYWTTQRPRPGVTLDLGGIARGLHPGGRENLVMRLGGSGFLIQLRHFFFEGKLRTLLYRRAQSAGRRA